MYCQKCGAQNDDNGYQCVRCGESLLPASMRPIPSGRIPNYLVQSILVTIFCCVPLGIPAIVFAAQVDGRANAGDLRGAMESSARAKFFCWLAVGLSLGSGVLYLLFMLLIGIGSNMK